MTENADSRTLRRWFTVGVVVIVLLAIWLIVRPLVMPIAWAAMLAFLLSPLQDMLTRRLRGKPSLAAGLLTALTPVAIFGPLTLIGIAFAQQVANLAVRLNNNPDVFDLSRLLDPQQHPRIAEVASWVGGRLNPGPLNLHDYVISSVRAWTGSMAKFSGQIFLNTASLVLSFFLMLFILFFVLRDGSAWFGRIGKLLPLSGEHRNALFVRLGKVCRAVVYGCGLTALVQGVLVGIGFAIAGLPGPVVFGVMASVLALLPFGGAAIVWLPAALYLLASGHIGMGVFLLAWGGVVSLSDNFIRPAIISRYAPVPTLLVFLGVVGGVSAFGLLGFIIGPVILVLATELLRYAEGSLSRRD